nr:tape measure protein [Rhodoferax sp. U2-2l]
MISVQREFDVLNSSLITVTGSSAAAAREFGWIKQFAATTPYQLNEVTGAFVKMKALGLDASAKALGSYGNTASAMGKDLNQMIEAVADAATGEFERLKEFGIKASKQGDQVSLTFQGVTKTIGNSAGEITGYLQAIGNNEFAGAMATRAATLDGAISNLADNWDALYRTVSSGAVGGLIFDSVTVASEAIKSAEGAVKSVAEAIIPATKVATAYFAIFVAAPAIYTMATAAMTSLIHATALHAYNMITGQAATIGLNTSLYGTSVAAQLAAGSLSKMALAGSALFAAFAGWQFGTYLRDQFVEVRVAGLAFIGAMMSGWEHLKYGAQLAGAALKSLLPGTESFAAAKARLSKEHAAEIDLIDQNIVELIQYETTVKSVTAAESASVPTKKAVTAATQAQLKAAEDLRKSYTAQAQALGDARNKEYDDIEKYMAAQTLSAIEAGNAADASVRAAQLELDQRGMLKSAIADTTAARLQEQLATKTAGTEAYDSLVRQINAQKALAGIYRSGEALDAVDDLQKANKRAAEASEKYWEDALMRAFESGKGFFESLWSTIKNTLKTQVLKVTVQGVMGSLGIGAAGAASAQGVGGSLGDLGGLGNLLMQGKSAWNAITSSGGNLTNFLLDSTANVADSLLQAGFETAGNAAYDFAEVMAKNADIINGAGSVLGYASAFNSLANGEYGKAAGQAIGTYIMPGIGTIVGSFIGSAVDSMFGGGGGPKTESSYGPSAGRGNTSSSGLAGSFALGVESAWEALAKQLEISTALKVGAFVSVDSAGTAKTQLATSGTVNGQNIYSRAGRGGGYENVGRSPEELQAALNEETTRILFAALKASDLPQQYKTYLSGIGNTVAEMSTAMSNVAVVHDFNKALASMPFESLKNLSFDAAKGLIEVSGGLENFSARLGTYYSLFYSESERLDQSTANIAKALAQVNVTMPTTKDEFRALVDGLNLSTEAGRTAYTVMMAVAPEFAAVADAVALATNDINKSFVDMLSDIGKSLTDLLGNIADQRAAVADSVAGINPTNMTMAQIQRAIAASSVSLPSNAGVMAANATLTAADAKYDLRTTQLATANTRVDSAFAAKQAAVAASAAQKSVTSEAIDLVATYLRFGNLNATRVAAPDSLSGMAVWNDSQANMEAKLAAKPLQDILAFAKTLSGLNLANGKDSGASFAQQAAEYKAAIATQAAAGPAIDGAVAAAQREYDLARGQRVWLTDEVAAASTKLTAAEAAAKAAATDYAKAMAAYAGDAEKATTKLGKLREETVKYYEAQAALASLMTTSATNLRAAVASISTSQLDPAAATAQKQREFAQYYSLALATTGANKAAYADKMAAALPALSDAIKSTSTVRDWTLATARLAAQSNTVAGQLDAAAAVDYQSESLAALASIDATLAGLEAGTNTAAGIISAAVAAGADLTAAGLRNVVTQLGGVPKFASGGYHAGGLRKVGENGPEWEVTGPSLIFNSSQTRSRPFGAQRGDNTEVVAELRALRQENAELRAEMRAITVHAAATADSIRRMDRNGVLVFTDPGSPIDTKVAA